MTGSSIGPGEPRNDEEEITFRKIIRLIAIQRGLLQFVQLMHDVPIGLKQETSINPSPSR